MSVNVKNFIKYCLIFMGRHAIHVFIKDVSNKGIKKNEFTNLTLRSIYH